MTPMMIREAIRMRADGCTYPEIGSALGVRTNAIRYALSSALGVEQRHVGYAMEFLTRLDERHRIAPDKILPPVTLSALAAEARRRRLSVEYLAALLLAIAVKDKLIGKLIDEDDELLE